MSDLIGRLQQTAHATRDDHAAHAIHAAVVELRRINAEADRLREMLNGQNRMIDDMATQRECAKACMRRMGELNREREISNMRRMDELAAGENSDG